MSRSPHGERGLKLSCCVINIISNPSLSSRRAWIEIVGLLIYLKN